MPNTNITPETEATFQAGLAAILDGGVPKIEFEDGKLFYSFPLASGDVSMPTVYQIEDDLNFVEFCEWVKEQGLTPEQEYRVFYTLDCMSHREIPILHRCLSLSPRGSSGGFLANLSKEDVENRSPSPERRWWLGE